MRLMYRRGELYGFVKGRCKATNLCAYCRVLGVVETSEMLFLDALEYAPQLLLTLTAREHLTRADTYDHLRQIRRSVRKLWPDCEWFVQVEFQKRGALHLHLLVKGVPTDAADAFLERVCAVWCSRVDAERPAQDCKPINAAQAVVRYLQKELSHGLKQEQAPPLGWRGHRTSQTRGYLVRPAAAMREEARRSLRTKRKLHAIMRDVPWADAGMIEAMLEQLQEQDDANIWSVVALHHGTPHELVEGRMIPLAPAQAAALSTDLQNAGVSTSTGAPGSATDQERGDCEARTTTTTARRRSPRVGGGGRSPQPAAPGPEAMAAALLPPPTLPELQS